MNSRPSASCDLIRSRGQLELELARLAMRVRRARVHADNGTFGDDTDRTQAAIAEWFDELGAEIASRTDPLLAAYARARIAALGGQLRIARAPVALVAGGGRGSASTAGAVRAPR